MELTGERYRSEYRNPPIEGIGANVFQGQPYMMHKLEGLAEATAELHALGGILLQLEARLASMEGRMDYLMPRPESAGESVSEQIAAFGRQVRVYREIHNLTLRQMANKTGVSATTLSRIERGITNFEQNTWQRIAGVVNRDFEEKEDTQDDY